MKSRFHRSRPHGPGHGAADPGRRPRSLRVRRRRGADGAVRGGGRARRRSVAELCAGREVVVTMLVEDATVLDVALGPGGLCESLARRRDPPRDGHARRRDRPRARSAHTRGGPDARRGAGARPARPGRGRSARHRRRRARTRRSRRVQPLLEVMGRRTFVGRRKAGVRDRDQAREQRRARLRDGRDGRGVLARPQVRRARRRSFRT